jgi:hypothetical protein
MTRMVSCVGRCDSERRQARISHGAFDIIVSPDVSREGLQVPDGMPLCRSSPFSCSSSALLGKSSPSSCGSKHTDQHGALGGSHGPERSVAFAKHNAGSYRSCRSRDGDLLHLAALR